MHKTAKLLEKGWTLDDDQKLEDVFEPCIIKQVMEESVCNICNENYNEYNLELNCCKNKICFTCAINHINSKIYCVQIQCPFCRGDLFGWLTIKKKNLIKENLSQEDANNDGKNNHEDEDDEDDDDDDDD